MIEPPGGRVVRWAFTDLKKGRKALRRRPTAFLVLSLLALAAAAGCSKPEPSAPGPAVPAAPPGAPAPAPDAGATAAEIAQGKVSFGRKCGVCHDIDRAAGDRRETREGWAAIVKDMRGKKAGWISDAEAAKILEYLVAEHGRK